MDRKRMEGKYSQKKKGRHDLQHMGLISVRCNVSATLQVITVNFKV